MGQQRALLAEGESRFRSVVRRLLTELSCVVDEVTTGRDAIARLRDSAPDLVVANLRLPGGDGLDILHAARERPGGAVVLFSDSPDVDTAVDAMRSGAADFLTLPLGEEELRRRFSVALGRGEPKGAAAAVSSARSAAAQASPDGLLDGEHPRIREVMRLIDRLAPSDATVLITGESGTGKELVARSIHLKSERASHPWVPVNCGAIPENLLESELFGHVKGAFTGAVTSRKGRFQLADGGTIFLDEIGEMSPILQVKLLRVLQTQMVEPVGGAHPQRVDFRVVAATNKDLEEEVARGNFREDLYYRLNVLPIHLPPLRERRSDIPVLLDHFIQRFNDRKGYAVEGVTPQALEILVEYRWPGNVRELENLVQRLVILKGSGIIEVDDLPPRLVRDRVEIPTDYHFPDEGVDFNALVSDFEDRLILSSLRRAKWNKNQAAKLLNLKRTTLVEKIKKKGLVPPSDSQNADTRESATD